MCPHLSFSSEKEKKKKRQEQHPSLENVILLYSSNCKQQSIFTKTHTKVDIIDLHTSILVNFVRPKHKNDLF